MTRKVATIISRIFDPFLMLGSVLLLFIWGRPNFLPTMIFMFVVPLVLFSIAWKLKAISNWDLSDRKERPKILWILIAIEIIGSMVFHVSEIFPMLIVFIGFAIITHYWKISGHMMSVALFTWVVVSRFGWGWWPILLCVPLVGWARVVRRDHTVGQVIVGAFYSWGLIFFYETWQSVFR